MIIFSIITLGIQLSANHSEVWLVSLGTPRYCRTSGVEIKITSVSLLSQAGSRTVWSANSISRTICLSDRAFIFATKTWSLFCRRKSWARSSAWPRILVRLEVFLRNEMGKNDYFNLPWLSNTDMKGLFSNDRSFQSKCRLSFLALIQWQYLIW